MLVTFKTHSYADITMFGEVAEVLLGMMGQSGTVPGAIMADDVPAAMASLKKALVNHPEAEQQPDSDSDDDDNRHVGLDTRAKPLLDLLESAIASNDNVQWDK